MVNKVVVSAISVILVVGAVLGVVAVVQYNKNSKSNDNGAVTSQKKAVQDFCSVSSYQKTCQKSLGSVNSTDPKELVTKAIEVSQEGVKKFFGYADGLIAKAQDNNSTKRALEICKEMMDLALMSLEKTLSEVGKAEMTDFEDRINDLRTWLSSVITYQETCKDGFADDKTLQEEIKKNILESRQIATNALDIISKLVDIMGEYGLQFALPTSRKLKSNDEYPEWISGSKRKLLGNLMDKNVKPNAVVAQDGSGQYKTIQDAVNAYPKGSKEPYVVYVKAGIYKEYVIVGKDHKNVIMYGDGPTKTVVTGRKSLKGPTDGGHKTIDTATFAALGEGFMVRDMGFENTAGSIGEQAVAFRTSADMCAVFNCKFDGFQDTLYLHSNRNFLKNIVVSGTVDFIFGDSIGVIQDSTIVVKKPMGSQKNIIVANGKEVPKENTGIVIQNCKVIADPSFQADTKVVETYLSRPWKPYSTTIFIGNTFPEWIKPEGYLPWEEVNTASETCFLAEYNNNGPGANVNQRVKWKGVHPNLDKETAMKWAPKAILHSGVGGPWLENTGIQINYNV